MHQIDEIIVIKEGRIIENGTFKQLMSNKGHLANLVGEHVQIIDEVIEPELDDKEMNMSMHIENNQLTLMEGNFSRQNSIKLIERNILSTVSMHIENNQMALLGGNYLRKDSIALIERNRMSIRTLKNEAPVPSDAEPMKLVLEDQSINYKEAPIITYLKSGSGVLITLAIFVLFFLVHGVRIGSGRFYTF